jgi:hypothetical protein
VALIAAVGCAVALAAKLIVRRHQVLDIQEFESVSPAPAAFGVALVMDAARLEPRLALILSVVVLAVPAFDAMSGLHRVKTA